VSGAGRLEARQGQANDAEAFRRQLLDAFARGDRRAVAGMVRYRLVVDAGGLMVPVMSRADLLNAQLERVSGEDASVRVVQQSGNRMLPSAGPVGRDARRLWAGRVPETGEYRVEVVRRGAYCDPPVNYQLKVGLE
jgi:hypothetical protein